MDFILRSMIIMDLKRFIENFAAQFFDTEPDEFQADTEFKELEEWSSLTVLTVIAMIDAEYGVTIDGGVINSVETIEELFEAVKAKK